MALLQILTLTGNKMGLDPSDPDQRSVLLTRVNEAVDEILTHSDLPGSVFEQVFKVNGDQTISFPYYVGKIRGMRELASMQTWHINQMRPRYYQFNWPDMWRNYRLKYESPLMASVKNQSVGVLTTPSVETPPVVITVSGPTRDSTSVTESIVMDAETKQTVNSFMDYTSVTKDRVNTYDITLSDIDGSLLTIIPNNVLSSIYQIVDVSACPWLPQNTSQLDNYMEVLYKVPIPKLVNNNDQFLNSQYDYIVCNKVMQIWAEEKEKPEIAQAYDAKATRSAARKVEDENRATEDMVAFVANPHDTVLKRIGTGIRRRFNLYAGRKY